MERGIPEKFQDFFDRLRVFIPASQKIHLPAPIRSSWLSLPWQYYTSENHLLNNELLALEFEQSASGPELWVGTIKGVSVVAYDLDGVTAATSYTKEDGLLNDSVIAHRSDSI